MTKQKLFLCFLFFLLLIPLSFSISLDELINSYDYLYDSDKINISSINHFGLDVDGGLYDFLVMNISMENEEGDYSVVGDLYNGNGFIQSSEKRIHLNQGKNVVELNFSPELMVNGSYNLSLTVSKGFLTEFRDENAYSFEFNNGGYEKLGVSVGFVGYHLIDLDDNFKYELLELNLSVGSALAGVFEIAVYLTGNNRTVISRGNYSVENGTNYVVAGFDSTVLRKNRISNVRLYSVEVKNSVDYVFLFNESIVYALADLDSETTLFAGSYGDSLSDLDGDGMAEYLNVSVGLDVVAGSDFTILGELYDVYNNYVASINQTFTLVSEDLHTVDLNINGTKIYTAKLNGPYLLKYLKLIENGQVLDSVLEPCMTKNYSYDSFEKPGLPDLGVSQLILDGDNLTSEIMNEGDGYAFGAVVSFFDQDFGGLGQKIISYLAPGSAETVQLVFNAQNITAVYAVVDYDNSIEESNESNNMFGYRAESFNLVLTPNWNLISLPITPKDNSITSIMSDCDFNRIWKFNNGWSSTDTGLSNLDIYHGYWVDRQGETDNCTLVIKGKIPKSTTINTTDGWTLVGYPSLTSRPISIFNISYTRIWEFDNGWKSTDTGLTHFTPGRGYWIDGLMGESYDVVN